MPETLRKMFAVVVCFVVAPILLPAQGAINASQKAAAQDEDRPAWKPAKPLPTVLSGIVLNGKGEPVAGARIFWQGADGSTPHVLRADADGRFRTRPLRAGLYEVRAEAGGMWSEWEHNVVLRTGKPVELTLRLVRTKRPPLAVKQAAQK
jgi:hypothetical protein